MRYFKPKPYVGTVLGKHPPGWTALCQVAGCTGYANFWCPDCDRPTCNGCGYEHEDLVEDLGVLMPETRVICQDCWEEL